MSDEPTLTMLHALVLPVKDDTVVDVRRYEKEMGGKWDSRIMQLAEFDVKRAATLNVTIAVGDCTVRVRTDPSGDVYVTMDAPHGPQSLTYRPSSIRAWETYIKPK